MGAKSTMLDVAKAAGVALGTVSNHLNCSVHVSPKTAAKIDRAIARLGYRIHLGARSLRAQRTQSVGLVLPNISNPFYAEVARAVEHSLWERGFQTLLCDSSQNAERELKHLDNLENRRVDGILIIHWDRPPRERLQRMTVPVVCVDRVVQGQLSVTTDNQLGGRLAARHLVSQGHRRIAVLAGQPTDNNVRERLRGFMAVLKEHNVEQPQVLSGPEQAIELGYEVGRLLDGGRACPTAIFATNDIVAVGAWRSLLELGIRIPQDMSLIGYDDIEMARLLIPPITTVAQDKAGVAREATALLLRVLDGQEGKGERRPVQLPPRLIVRGSTAPPSEARSGRSAVRQAGRKSRKGPAVTTTTP